MALTQEQIAELKAQLSEQIQSLPEEQQIAAQQQIDSMSDEAIEAMLNQQQSQNPQKGIFRKIVDGEVQSKKIDENKDCIAVLDIHPISLGHIIIIPKSAVSNAKHLPTSIFTLAKKMAKRVSSKLKSKSSEIQTEFKFGEIIINVIPIYDKSLNINSTRQEVDEKTLQEIYNKLKIVKRQIIKKTKVKTKSTYQLKRRTP